MKRRICGFFPRSAIIVPFKKMDTNQRGVSVFLALFLCTAIAVWLIAPSIASADHTFIHTVQELRIRFSAFLESALGMRLAGVSQHSALATLLAAADDARIQKLETELQSYEARIGELKSQPQTEGEKRELQSLEDEMSFVQSKLDELRSGGLRLTRMLQRGSAGGDVRRLQEFLAQDKSVYPEGLATGYFGKLTEDAVKKFQEKNGIEPAGMVGPKTREKINALAAGGQGAVSVGQPIAPRGLLSRTLERGASGNDVKSAQGLLNRFPDIYPDGSATGIYGSATENAVKKLQEKLGLPATGGIDGATKKKINELAQAVERKQPPKITSVAPAEISIGTKATITGSGFALENNSLFVKGKTILTGLASHDGATIIFAVPSDVPCDVGQACPIKITNANGISNAKPFKLVAAAPVPEPEPTPEPTPAPTPTPTPTAKPDLTVSDIYSDSGKLSVKVANIGTVSAPSNTGHLYIWIDGELKWTYGLSTLADQSFLLAGGITVVQPQLLYGDHAIKAFIDPMNAIDESNETNNILEKTVTFPSGTVVPPPSPCAAAVTLNVPAQYPTIQGAINAASCPGTIIQIAAGTYYEILTLKSDLTLIGAGPGQTIIDGSKTPATVNPWGYLVQNFDVITAGKPGAGVQNVRIKNLSITGSGAYGDNAAIRIQDSGTVFIENVLFYKNTDGLRIYSSSPVTVKNATMTGSRNGIMSHGSTVITVKNSIIAQNSAWGLYAVSGVQLTSAHNDVWGNGTNYDGVVPGVGDISLDPRLGSAPQYLALSDSSTIDAGDPADAYSLEPLPNGDRINMGSYGNTPWATSKFIPAPVPAPSPTAEAPTNIAAHWGAGGTGMPPVWTYSHKIKFSYATTSIANVQSFRLYQKRPGDASFSLAATFSNPGAIAQTCSGSVRSAPWSLYYYCPPVANPPYWIAEIVNGQPASYYPVGEYDFYLAAVNTSGVEGPPSSIAVQYAVERTVILSPTGLQSTATPTFRWTAASGWPTLPATYAIRVASSKGIAYSLNLDTTQSPEASKTYDGSPLDPSLTYSVVIFGSMVSNGRYYISMNEAPTMFQVSVPVAAAPNIISASPSYGNTGTAVKITGSGFTASGNEVHFYNLLTDPHTVVSNISSSDGLSLSVIVPSNLPCSELENCTLFVKNANGTSNTIQFFRTLTVVPVQVYAPNGGEAFVQGGQNPLIHYAGGNLGLYVGIAAETATTNADPTDQALGWIWSTAPGDRTIGWDGKTLCDFPGCNVTTTHWTIGPGRYKVIASSHNEFGKTDLYDPATGKLGNFDLSDAPFSVVAAPTPTVSVVAPNGGETYKHGDAITITWKSENIKSRAVNIKLVRATTTVLTIASNVPQSAETGLFLYNWAIPNYLVPAPDYAIEISDSANSAVKDTSDTAFRISYNAALQIYGPNGGETAMRGFSALLFWTYSGYTPTTINVNLYKGGALYRTLATGVKPVGFSGYTFLQASYPTNSRYAEVPIALDIPEGDDYTLEIVDGTDVAILDRSDGPFRIITLPTPVTFTGRMVDALSGAPMPNITFSEWASSGWIQRFITGANGEFSYSTTTASLIDPAIKNQLIAAGWPPCNDATTLSVSRFVDFPRIAFGGWFGNLYPLSSVRRQYLPVVSSVMNLGDVPLWPSTDFIHTFTDFPSNFMAYYSGGGMGNSAYTVQHGLQNTPPLGVDTYIQYKDKVGALYTSPVTRFSADARCLITTHSFMDGIYQWEPYPIGISYSAAGGTAGALYAGKLTTFASNYGYSVGATPLAWSVAFGSLPPGLSLNSATGEITGIPTTIGTYVFGVRVHDANGVRASRDMTIVIR